MTTCSRTWSTFEMRRGDVAQTTIPSFGSFSTSEVRRIQFRKTVLFWFAFNGVRDATGRPVIWRYWNSFRLHRITYDLRPHICTYIWIEYTYTSRPCARVNHEYRFLPHLFHTTSDNHKKNYCTDHNANHYGRFIPFDKSHSLQATKRELYN